MTNNQPEVRKVGGRVKIQGTNFKTPGKIVEYRGPLGPGGTRIYRVRYRDKPYPAYAEFREDQLEVVAMGTGNGA